MKKNILNVMFALCFVSFSTVMTAQSTQTQPTSDISRQQPVAVPIEEMMKNEPLPPISNEPHGDEVFQVIEKQAEFPGGQASLFNWLGANIKYPEEARKSKIQGRIILRFIVEKNGSITGVTVLRGAHNLLDAEAVRVVKSMPTWKAGMQRGNFVRSYFTLPIVFKLDEKTNAKAEDKN